MGGHIDILKLQPLSNKTSGSPIIKIGLIDEPVETNHIDFNNEHVYEVPGTLSGTCSKTEIFVYTHGTFIAGVLRLSYVTIEPW